MRIVVAAVRRAICGRRHIAGSAYRDVNVKKIGPIKYGVGAARFARTGPGTLTPDETRHSLLATFTQAVTSDFEIGGDFMASGRKVKNSGTDDTLGVPLFLNTFVANSSTNQYSGNIGAAIKLSSRLNASLRVDTNGEGQVK